MARSSRERTSSRDGGSLVETGSSCFNLSLCVSRAMQSIGKVSQKGVWCKLDPCSARGDAIQRNGTASTVNAKQARPASPTTPQGYTYVARLACRHLQSLTLLTADLQAASQRGPAIGEDSGAPRGEKCTLRMVERRCESVLLGPSDCGRHPPGHRDCDPELTERDPVNQGIQAAAYSKV